MRLWLVVIVIIISVYAFKAIVIKIDKNLAIVAKFQLSIFNGMKEAIDARLFANFIDKKDALATASLFADCAHFEHGSGALAALFGGSGRGLYCGSRGGNEKVHWAKSYGCHCFDLGKFLIMAMKKSILGELRAPLTP